jgi:hypothetical protein
MDPKERVWGHELDDTKGTVIFQNIADYSLTQWHSITSQKTWIFSNTAVRT